MSQATLSDDELFGEAASEMREDVESSLDAGWDALPAPDDIWETDAENVLGVLNGLKTALDAGDAIDHLHDAKKWFTMGQRAGAFDDAADLESDIEELENAIEDVTDASDQLGEVVATIPSLRSTLENAGNRGGDEGEGEDGEGTAAEGEGEGEDDGETETDTDADADADTDDSE